MATRNVETYRNGQLVSTTQVTVPDQVANVDTVMDRAAQAVTANNNFLAIASPTNAQTLTQVQRLTRECNGLIKFLLNQFDDTTGT